MDYFECCLLRSVARRALHALCGHASSAAADAQRICRARIPPADQLSCGCPEANDVSQYTLLSSQVDEKPSEDYSDVGGLDKQIKELVEAIVLPVTHKDKFKALGIRPPKGLYNILCGQSRSAWQWPECQNLGFVCCIWNTCPCCVVSLSAGVLLYGPPGTGKTLLARACAAQTNATFLKLAGPQLVQMFIGDGAKLVRPCL